MRRDLCRNERFVGVARPKNLGVRRCHFDDMVILCNLSLGPWLFRSLDDLHGGIAADRDIEQRLSF